MLSSKKRLTKALFKEVIDKGRSFHSPMFTMRVMKFTGDSQFSVTVPKKVAKSAVERNKMRRRGYSAIRSIYPKIKAGFKGILIAKPTMLKSSFKEVSSEIEEFFVKSGLLK